jgi:predicted ATP-grasp superfamily ATP-dependent carboligase
MTHLPSPAKSPSKNGALLIASISGRALAAAARRAGHRPLVVDLFRDCDTVALAERAMKLPGDLHSGMGGDGLVPALRQLAGDERPAALVLGSVFERQPELVESLARHFPVAGCGGEAIRAVKDPDRLARACAELGIPHPEISWKTPSDPENWVVKTSGGAGGSHIGRANGEPLPAGRYFQRFVEGDSVSALFVAAGKDTRIVGFSRQWVARAPGAPYRYGGAVRLRRFPRDIAERIGGWLRALARHANLVGLCSADFIRSDSGYTLIEINPRPGATLDIFDDHKAPLITAHLDASAGRPFRLPEFTDAMASMIAYTDAPIASFPAFAWPDWAADRQSPGTRLAAGDPVCTIFARGLSVAVTCKTLKANALSLQSHWEGGGP